MKNGKSFSEVILQRDLKEHLNAFIEFCADDIIFTTYETLRSKVLEFACVDFSIVILDEAQKIKNPASSQSSAAKSLKSSFNLALTGTPIENSILDLYWIMDFVKNKKLGSLKEFKDKYEKTINSSEAFSEDRKNLKTHLETDLNPFWIRRLKSSLGNDEFNVEINYSEDYNEKTKEITNSCLVQMSKKQISLYKDREKYYVNAKGSQKLEGIKELIEICHSPWRKLDQGDLDFNRFDEMIALSPKLKLTIEILDKIKSKNEKVIIFNNRKKSSYELKDFLNKYFRRNGVPDLEIDVYNGDINPKERKNVLHRFKEKVGFNVIIISPRAGGVGLNLTCANHVIHYTR